MSNFIKKADKGGEYDQRLVRLYEKERELANLKSKWEEVNQNLGNDATEASIKRALGDIKAYFPTNKEVTNNYTELTTFSWTTVLNNRTKKIRELINPSKLFNDEINEVAIKVTQAKQEKVKTRDKLKKEIQKIRDTTEQGIYDPIVWPLNTIEKTNNTPNIGEIFITLLNDLSKERVKEESGKRANDGGGMEYDGISLQTDNRTYIDPIKIGKAREKFATAYDKILQGLDTRIKKIEGEGKLVNVEDYKTLKTNYKIAKETKYRPKSLFDNCYPSPE